MLKRRLQKHLFMALFLLNYFRVSELFVLLLFFQVWKYHFLTFPVLQFFFQLLPQELFIVILNISIPVFQLFVLALLHRFKSRADVVLVLELLRIFFPDILQVWHTLDFLEFPWKLNDLLVLKVYTVLDFLLFRSAKLLRLVQTAVFAAAVIVIVIAIVYVRCRG